MIKFNRCNKTNAKMRLSEVASPSSSIQCTVAYVRSFHRLPFSGRFEVQHLCTANHLKETEHCPELGIDEHTTVTNRAYWTRKIHKLCAYDRNVDEALRILDHLRLQGFFPDSLNVSSVIHALCNARRFLEAHTRFVLALSAHPHVLDERTCNVIIARLLDARSPESTLHVIRALLRGKPEFVPSLMNYNRLIDQFCAVSRPRDAHKLFVEMRNRGHCPNVVSYTTLIKGYCRVGEICSAWNLFYEMSSGRVSQPNPLTYSTLIQGVLRNREVEEGNALIGNLWKVMAIEEDIHVNTAAFANVIDSLCREGLFHEVFNIAEDMPQGKSVVEEFAYGQMIDSLCRYKRYNGAARIIYMMKKRGSKPSLVSYNTIVHGICKEGDFFRAYQLFDEGIQLGYSPSEFTYKILIDGLCSLSDLPKAKHVLRIMLNKKSADKTRIYNIYLRSVCLSSNPTELLNTLLAMLQSQCRPDIISLNTVVNGLCKMARVEEAMKVLHDMMSGKKFCSPDAATYTTAIAGLLEVGRDEEALNLLRYTMPNNGFTPGVVTYNAVLRGFFKMNRVDEAMEIFNSSGVPANPITHTIVIDGLFDSGRIDEAKRFWDAIVWPSGVHDEYVYSAILKGLCRSERVDEACHFLYELMDSGVSLCLVNYNIVIHGASQLGLKAEVYRIVGEMRKNGLTPDAVTWRILDKLNDKTRMKFCEDTYSQ
ncbi:unnamed protein product [Cuscuta europaea]|uniref:Pentatricopeptide repeat-containing protein n=1 Tax=Cuscuta europaea TaxID=41803 RepID=A0A9P0Z1R9_CUSEU|nr:unnamed protein product [Cuscuta europaea]